MVQVHEYLATHSGERGLPSCYGCACVGRFMKGRRSVVAALVLLPKDRVVISEADPAAHASSAEWKPG